MIGSPVVWVGTERFQLSHDGLFLKEGAAAVDICVLYCDKHTHAHTHTTGSEKNANYYITNFLFYDNLKVKQIYGILINRLKTPCL